MENKHNFYGKFSFIKFTDAVFEFANHYFTMYYPVKIYINLFNQYCRELCYSIRLNANQVQKDFVKLLIYKWVSI